jgi:hypothetical protein
VIVDCEASGAPLIGQRQTAIFTSGPCRSRSMASLWPAGNRPDARHHHLEHRVMDAARIAAIRHRFVKPPANA